jgi:hypothetical protein
MAVIIPGRNRGDPPVMFVPERMGFGHLSSPAFFSGIVGDMLTGISHGAQRCRSYLDDITGGAKGGYKEAYALFEDIMQRTAASGMLFAFDKLQLLVPELRVLGLIVNPSGVEPDPARRGRRCGLPCSTTCGARTRHDSIARERLADVFSSRSLYRGGTWLARQGSRRSSFFQRAGKEGTRPLSCSAVTLLLPRWACRTDGSTIRAASR